MHVKRGDIVKVISGKDKGEKKVKSLRLFLKQGKVLSRVLQSQKNTRKQRVQGQESGIIHMETAIDASNVIEKVRQSAASLQEQALGSTEDGSKVRYCKKCKETFND